MKNLTDWLYKISNGWTVVAGLLIFSLFLVLVLPAQAEKADKYSRDAGSPDQSFIYSADDLYRMAEAYGSEGRAAYVNARVTFDVIFPIAYAFFLLTSIGWTLSKASAKGSTWRWFIYFPLLGLVFDYLENTGAAIVMSRFPAESPLIAEITPVFTLIKWFFVNGSFVVLIGGLVAAVVGRIKERK